MAYVAVKGGKEAIEASIKRLKYERLRKRALLEVEAIQAGMGGLIDQIMSESSLYSEKLAALAIKQAQGSPEEAVFLLRAYRSTLPRAYYTQIVDPAEMKVERRISASFKDIPGGQLLGASPDYGHRLLDFELLDETWQDAAAWLEAFMNETCDPSEVLLKLPKVVDYLRKQGLMPHQPDQNQVPTDITKKNLEFPLNRSQRLQILTRGQTGAVTSLAYAVLRAYGAAHPNVGELRIGLIPLTIQAPDDPLHDPEEAYYMGEIKVTEVETFFPHFEKVNNNGQDQVQPKFEIGYGLAYGQNETKAIAMSILDYALEEKRGENLLHDEEFVLMHIDSVESTGFISHLKLPHYVTFQSELDSLRKIQKGGPQP